MRAPRHLSAGIPRLQRNGIPRATLMARFGAQPAVVIDFRGPARGVERRRADRVLTLQEDAEVLVEQDVGVEHNRAAPHPPRAVHLAQQILAATGEELMIRLQVRTRNAVLASPFSSSAASRLP